MTGETWGVLATITTVVLGLVVFVWQVQQAAKADARKVAEDRAKAATDARTEGAASRDDEVRLLKSERDDARSDRDDARRDRDYWREKYNDLQERRGGST